MTSGAGRPFCERAYLAMKPAYSAPGNATTYSSPCGREDRHPITAGAAVAELGGYGKRPPVDL